MLTHKDPVALIDELFRFDDSPYLALRLRKLAKLFDDLDVDKRMLCDEAATNLDLMYEQLHQMAARLITKAPDDAGAEQ